MNFAYGVIAAVGVLVAISLGLIASSPDDVIEPRMMTVDDKPKPCTKEYRPVCGVDEKTYGNMCTLESAGVELDYEGECVVADEPVACTLDWRPVCGVDGETYGNLCMLEAAGVELDYEGECVVADEPVACTLEYLPVCGVDGETYGNLCMLEAAGVELDYEGECVVAESQTEPQLMEEVMETEPSSMSFDVSIPKGTGVPGCEDTNECFIPYEFTVKAGTTVTWSNDDTASHTVTSGNINAGPTSAFDSGMLMAGNTFEFTFKGSGNFDYFCMIHPWMTGIVHVN